MSELLVTAGIYSWDPGPEHDQLLLSYSSDLENWCTFLVPQASTEAPSFTVWNGKLWSAFQGAHESSIYVAALADWAANKPINESSNLAPATAAFGGKLWVAYVGQASGNVELVFSSDASSWSPKIDTGQSSKAACAAAAFMGKLYIAFLESTTGKIEIVSSNDGHAWLPKSETGQSSTLPCAMAVFRDELWLAYIGETSRGVELIHSADGSKWSSKIETGQNSKFGCSLAVFNQKLWAVYVGEATGQVELISSSDGKSWSGKSSTGLAISMTPAAAVVDAAAAPTPLAGSSQYVFASPTEPGKAYVALQDLQVEICVYEDIVVSPKSGLTDKIQTPQPIGFQINGFSQKGDKTICWQQYGVQMNAGNNQLTSFAENWPQSLNTNPKAPNVFNLGSPNSYPLPNNLTIPAGTVISLEFDQQNDGTISGFSCTVTPPVGDWSEPTDAFLNIDLVGQPLAAGGKISQKDLAKIVAFQVVLVGWENDTQAKLTSGSGWIRCKSSTPMTPSNEWPKDSDGTNGTGESANSIYGMVPAEASTMIVQWFGVSRS